MKDIRPSEVGSVMIALVTVIMIVAGFSGVMLMRGLGGHKAATSNVQASKLLFVAEAGLNYNFVEMVSDKIYAARRFSFDGAGVHYASPMITLDSSATTTPQSFQLDVQYLDGGIPVPIIDLVNPRPFDQVKVTCSASNSRAERVVAAWYTLTTSQVIGGAIVSDMAPTGTSGEEKDRAKQGHIVIDGKGRADQQYVFGNIRANGEVLWQDEGAPVPLTDANADSFLGAHGGMITQNLLGSDDEIPDFTNLGGTEQLFDFERFRAAAVAGAGQRFFTMADFASAMNDVNDDNNDEKLEGIIVLEIDPALEGSDPKFVGPGSVEEGEHQILKGINITGTLMFKFADGTDPQYKIFITTDLNVNAADLQFVDLALEDSYTSGYPGIYQDVGMMPSAKDISPAYENFYVDDDMPAVMFNNGVVDIHGAANVCGVVYGPSFIEIENKDKKLQYFNGAIYGGGGVYLQGSDLPPGKQAIRYDPSTVDRLTTQDDKGAVFTRTGFAILK